MDHAVKWLMLMLLLAAPLAAAQSYDVRVVEYSHYHDVTKDSPRSLPDHVLAGKWPLQLSALTHALERPGLLNGIFVDAMHRDALKAGELQSYEHVSVGLRDVTRTEAHVTLHVNGAAKDLELTVPMNGTAVVSGDVEAAHNDLVAVSVLDPATAAAVPQVYPVRDDVKAPVVVRRVNPVYPASVRRNHVSGIVIMQTEVDEAGNLVDAYVVKPLIGLTEPALDAIRQWRFTPATRNGEPVRSLFALTIQFKLR
jgi:TonB family protein